MRLGIGKQAIYLAVFLLFSASALGQAGKSFKYQFNGNLQKSDAITESGSLIINYSISELNLENIQNENGNFFRISIPDHIWSVKPGKPQMPVLSRLITIPEGMTYRIKISNIKTTKINPAAKKIDGILFPAQESQTKVLQQKKPAFKFDKDLYATRGIIPDDTVSIEMLGTIGYRRVANLYISPVKYNPHSNSAEVITSMKIEIRYIFPDGNISKSISYGNSSFTPFPDKGILATTTADLIPGFTDQPVRMVIITDTAFRKGLQPFFKWKTQKGFKLDILYKGAAFAGTTYLQLKDTLTKIWNASTETNPAPQYLLIIGDVSRIPYYGTGNVTDMYYGEFTGNGDFIPEMLIGRLPVADTAELRTATQKIIQYEKFAFADTNTFYSRALVTAGEDGGYATYMNGQVRYALENYLIPANKLSEYHFYYPESAGVKVADSLKKIIAKGVGLINYTGHGAVEGWLKNPNIPTYYFKSVSVPTLENKNMYPVILSNACRTGTFSSATSLGNKMVLTANAGAVGFIGCSNDSYWEEDYFWAVGNGTPTSTPTYATTGLGAFDRLFHTHGESASNWHFTLGQINFAGNIAVSESTTSRKKYYWETYNVIGDPTLIPILGKPDNFTLTLPDNLPNGIKTFSLNVNPFAYVSVSHFDTLWDASYASPSGTVTLNMPGLSNDSCLIVITGQNKKPIIKTIYFTDITSEYINLLSSSINDIQGNNNQRADFGEKVFLNLKVSNLGLTTASGLYAKISSASPWITIQSDSTFIGSLGPKGEISLPDKLGFNVDANVPDKTIVTISLVLKDNKEEKHYNIDLRVHAPLLQLISCVIDDSEVGNNNHIADPGETFNLIFKVNNLGSSDISGQFTVSSTSSDIFLLPSSVKSGTIKFGELTNIPVTVKLSEIAATGNVVSLTSLLDCSPYIVNKEFSFRVGRIRESFEGSSFNIFPWFNTSAIPWITSSLSSYDGALSARSGAIPHKSSTTLMIKTSYPQADSLRFYYRVSSEAGYDFFTFRLNGTELLKKAGEVPWTRKAVYVPPGINKMEWIYKKDDSVIGGADCAWLDMVDFALTSSVTYIQKDIEVAKVVSPVQIDKLGMETVTVKLLNTGRDIITGFNLAFRTNNQALQVTEYFENQLIPGGDTVTVSFKTKADLSKYGLYKFAAFGSENKDDYLLNDTVKVSLENMNLSETVSVFPNPFRDQITVYLNSMINQNLTVSIIDSKGQTLYITEKSAVKGRNTITITDAKLIPGVYYLNIKGIVISKTVPVMKIR
jgi:hypothetical protein